LFSIKPAYPFSSCYKTQDEKSSLRVLLLHNRYKQPGGEDVVVRAEGELLRGNGHEVALLEVDNAEISGLVGRVKAAMATIYSPDAKARVAARIASFRPDIVHVHNFFPLLSPSIYYACGEAGIPVVQTLHNYRLICSNAQLLRDGHICEECLRRSVPWPGVLHSCYRGSRMGSVTVAAMLATHRRLGTWKNAVCTFIALTDFSREKLIEGGLPAGKIVVKPNFVRDRETYSNGCGGFALFVGRLSPEKGIEILLEAWERLKIEIPLKIVGDGPLVGRVMRATKLQGCEWLGHLPGESVRRLEGEASFLIVPSLCYENFPLTIAEAYAASLPVVAAGHGSMASLVEHGRTGLQFRPGDAGDLAAKVEWAATHPEEMARMRHEARSEYLAKYTPERNYKMLMEIYDRVTCRNKVVNVGSRVPKL
jgi:glycosyltransferase involved in cell wall biosynthesis